MICYKYPEEEIVATFFAEKFNDKLSLEILRRGKILSKEEAVHFSRFFWNMVNNSAEGGVVLPCEGGSELWLEKLYNSLGGFIEREGYENEWNEEIDRA